MGHSGENLPVRPVFPSDVLSAYYVPDGQSVVISENYAASCCATVTTVGKLSVPVPAELLPTTW